MPCIRGHGLLVVPGRCWLLGTGVKAAQTPLNGHGRMQKRKGGKRLPENEQACSWGVWRRMSSFLRGHAAPMECIFRKIGKNPFHLLSGNFNQDTLAAFLFYFLPRSFFGCAVKNVRCPLVGMIGSDPRAVGRILPGRAGPGLLGRMNTS